MNELELRRMRDIAEGQPAMDKLACDEIENLLPQDGERSTNQQLQEIARICSGIAMHYKTIGSSWEKVAQNHREVIHMRESTTMAQTREAQVAHSQAVKIARKISRNQRKGTPQGHTCASVGCDRMAHFFTETGYWCKRHVPETERPKGKIA